MTGKSSGGDDPLRGVGVSRRELIGRIVKGSAFAVPVVASFDMSSLGVGTAYANNANQYPNTPPFFASANTTTFTVGTAGTFTIETPGTPDITLTQTGTLPKGVTFTANDYNNDYDNNISGYLSGTPAAGTGGSYPLTFHASGPVGPPATQAFVLVVNAPTVITSANAMTVTEGQPADFTVTTSGTPAPVISATSLPPGMTLVNNQANGTAVLGGVPSTPGVYPLTLTAYNGVSPAAVQAFTVTVAALPVTVSNSFVVSQISTGRTASISFAVQVPGPGTISATLTGLAPAPAAKGKGKGKPKAKPKPKPRKPVTLATAMSTIGQLGELTLQTVPNKAGTALAASRKRRSETLTLTVTFSPVGGTPATQTFGGLHLK